LAGWWALTWFAWAAAGVASLFTVFFLAPILGGDPNDSGSGARFIFTLLFIDGLFYGSALCVPLSQMLGARCPPLRLLVPSTSAAFAVGALATPIAFGLFGVASRLALGDVTLSLIAGGAFGFAAPAVAVATVTSVLLKDRIPAVSWWASLLVVGLVVSKLPLVVLLLDGTSLGSLAANRFLLEPALVAVPSGLGMWMALRTRPERVAAHAEQPAA
jgi:hypothetical protein